MIFFEKQTIYFFKILQADDPQIHHPASLGKSRAVADNVSIHESHQPSRNGPAHNRHGSNTAQGRYKRFDHRSRTSADEQTNAGTNPCAYSNRPHDNGHYRRF